MARGGSDSGCGCYLAFMAALFVGSYFFSGADDSPSYTPAPAPSPTGVYASYEPVTWSYSGAQCSDGWPSSSIGHQGACSHHGGVVSVWQGSDGTMLTCRGMPPIGREAQVAELESQGRLFC